MTEDEIQARLDALVTAMMAKGIKLPEATVNIRGGATSFVVLYCAVAAKQFDGSWARYFNIPLAAALDEAAAYIAALPEPETLALQSHLRRVADCIDKAREDAIDAAYVTPLVSVKAAMTENLLTNGVAK